MAGGKPGFVIGLRPKNYKTTSQQSRIKEAAEFCGIKKGMTRAELVDKMRNCLPKYFEEIKGREDETPRPLTVISEPVKVFVSTNCGPCQRVKQLIKEGKFNREDVELLDLETEEGFAYIKKLGINKVPSAYQGGQSCKIGFDNDILLIQCPGDEVEEVPEATT